VLSHAPDTVLGGDLAMVILTLCYSMLRYVTLCYVRLCYGMVCNVLLCVLTRAPNSIHGGDSGDGKPSNNVMVCYGV
jgi:hypothetical protein